jgi:hypothetical protein
MVGMLFLKLYNRQHKVSGQVDKRANISPDTTFVTGGTCSAMRAIGMSHILGFRNFHLFGFDCNIPNVTPEMEKEETEDGKKKYLKVETNGVTSGLQVSCLLWHRIVNVYLVIKTLI